ncbi:MAG: YafY family transcriptional regulator [Acidobacteria bacterium]|nr:YafY family transcriptional regulator [Acidobacteriota bacterium]
MLETSARLLRLLSLFQSRRYWSGLELAERLEVTSRTLRRDVDKLRNLGYPIHSCTGAEGGYQLGAGSDMPPLLLDDDEAVAVFAGLRSAGSIAGVEEASVRALAKMEQILPPRLARRVAALQTMVVRPAAGSDAVVDAKTLTMLAGSCRDNEALRFQYRDHSGKPTARRVEPFRLVHTGRRWYLVAWDRDREDWRTFRVDRIGGRPAADGRFAARPAPAGDLAAFATEGYWRSLEKCRARIKVMLPVDEAVRRFPGGVFVALDDTSCIWEAAATCYDRLAIHLGWIGADFEVVGPEELIAAVIRMRERYERAVAERCKTV